MEDLKKYLSIAAKHSFWILTGLVLILSTAFFVLTKMGLDESIATRKSALEASFKKIKDVAGKTSTHPNDYSHKEMERRLVGLQEDVDRAWEFQYERQKEFLTWPTEAFFETKTHEIFDSLRPFEKVPFPLPEKPAPPLDAITRTDRTVYKNYIAPEFPALARRIGSTWKFALDAAAMTPAQGGFAPPPGAGGFAPPGFGSAGATPQESRDLVRWSEESQKALASAVLPWFGRTMPPDIHEIYYAQEDIWILRGLMDIIAQTNSGAKENFQAIVKEIEWIRTGPRASRDVGSLWAAGSAMPGSGGSSPYGGGGPPSGYSGGGAGGMPSGYGGAGGPMGGKGGEAANAVRAAIRIDPADGRYVDANLKPLTGAQLRSAMNLQSPTDAVNAVAKRVQVRMRLKVDERFGKLITECGNGKMMLEVLQVRYNTDPAPDGGAAGGGGGGSSGGGSKPTFGGAGIGGGGGAGMLGDGEESGLSGAATQAAEVVGGEVSIEIYGLIYLFNPPANLSKTNASATPAAAAPAATAPTAAAPPAAAPPAAATPVSPPPAGGAEETATTATPQADEGGPASEGAVETPVNPLQPPATEPAPETPTEENPGDVPPAAEPESPTPPAPPSEPAGEGGGN